MATPQHAVGSADISVSGSGDGTIQDGANPAIEATVLDLANANPLTVAITDATGTQITSFGGGTQYTEGDVDASITGTAAMMEVAGNTLAPVQGSVAGGLLVDLGVNNDVTVTGTVTANAGTNLNTSALLTTVAHDAAFGTAGAADAQVRSIQGIASMTPVQVQSNSADLATAAAQTTGNASLASIDGKLTSPLTVQATNLDIHDLAFATDKVDVSGSTVVANAGTNLNTSLLSLEATQVAVAASLSVIDDWDESDRAKVNPIVGQAGVQAGAGSVSANTQRVVIADDQTPIPITGSISATSAATATVLPPTYVEGAASDLSQDLAGNLRTIRAPAEASDTDTIINLLRQILLEIRASNLISQSIYNLDDADSFRDPTYITQVT